MGEPYRLEGFDAGLRGRRIFVVGVDSGLRRLSALESEALYRGKNVLVHGDGHAPFTVGRRKWDAVFRLKDPFDAQMIATYVANAPKPVRVFWFCAGTGHDAIPRALWSRWVKQDITLLGCSDGLQAPLADWEAIFFSHKCDTGVVERTLVSRGVGSSLTTIREHLSELAESGAALVWSNIDGTGSGGLYWYDPESVAEIGSGFTRIEIGQLLDTIKKWTIGSGGNGIA